MTSTLSDNCADFVVAGQAFHWFDPVKAGGELRRILRPNGWAMLVWNMRDAAVRTFPNEQLFDFEGLKGRSLSSSYAPLPGHPDHEPLLSRLRQENPISQMAYTLEK